MEDLKFESDEIDLDEVVVNQIVSGILENLEFENRMFAEFLESLGYSAEQISDIARMGVGFNQTNSGD